jgi:hypothetical protein
MSKSKYRKEVAERICEMIRLDTYTINEICAAVNIVPATFHEWKKTNNDFSEMIKKARDDRDLKLVKEARNSLMKKVTGYSVTEEKTVYVTGTDGLPTIKEQTTQTKYFQPDTAAIIFTLCNRDNWVNSY